MTYQKLDVEIAGDVGIIRLNDPAVMNAVSFTMILELGTALDQVFSSCRAMILTGGETFFCAGANLKEAVAPVGDDGLPDAGIVLESHMNPLMIRLRQAPIPWISAVRGAAAGIGCSLALAADMVVASDTAYFLQAFSRIGLVPDGGSSFLLARTIGRVRAMEMMLLAERLPAAKALEWALVNRVVPDQDIVAVSLELARSLARGPTRALGMIRELAWTATDGDWVKCLSDERRLQREACRTKDHQEGVTAFLEKRPAKFVGG